MPPYPDVPGALETDRLILRPPRLEDVPMLYASVRESLPELRTWMSWATPDYSLEDCEVNTREAIARFITRESLRYGLHDKETGEHLGSSEFHALDWGVPKCEIGYWCRTSKVGKGYVSEAVQALTTLALKGFGAARVEIRCDALNERSWRVAQRCGFVLEGTLRHTSRRPDGSLRDTRVYARTT